MKPQLKRNSKMSNIQGEIKTSKLQFTENNVKEENPKKIINGISEIKNSILNFTDVKINSKIRNSKFCKNTPDKLKLFENIADLSEQKYKFNICLGIMNIF